MFFEIQELHITSSAESGFVATNNYLALVQLSMKAVNHRIANSPRERTKYVVRLNIHSGNGVRTSLCCSVLPGAPTYGLVLGTLWMQQHRILVDTYRNFAPGLFKGRKIGIHGEYGARNQSSTERVQTRRPRARVRLRTVFPDAVPPVTDETKFKVDSVHDYPGCSVNDRDRAIQQIEE
eukprot:scaffold7_cov414-Pavlova_lutheri.AAC.25